jgi:hypothetical protein
MSTEANNTINHLDTLIRRGNDITIELYRKTETGTIIHFHSNHPLEHKISAFLYYINRLTTMPIIESSKQRGWETIITIARSNNFLTSMLQGLKTILINRKRQKQTQQQQEIITLQDKWVTFTYFSPLVRWVTNLFRRARLRIAFRATNSIQQQLNTAKYTHDYPSGI